MTNPYRDEKMLLLRKKDEHLMRIGDMLETMVRNSSTIADRLQGIEAQSREINNQLINISYKLDQR